MQVLEAPAVLHQLDRQPVEQLGMRRRVALCAEVFAARDDPCAKVRLPDAVHLDARGRGAAPIDDPVGERQSVVGQVCNLPVTLRVWARRIGG